MTISAKLAKKLDAKIWTVFSKVVSEMNYRLELVKHIGQSPKLSTADRVLCEELKQKGIVITSLDDFSLPSTPQFRKAVDEFLPQLKQASIEGNLSSNQRAAGSHCLYGDSVAIGQNFPAIYLWGLENRILDILENYYGAPVACIGVNMRRDLADATQKGTKLWHLDGEDRKVIKVVVYLSDVDEDGGPFEYIPDHLSPSYRDFESSLILDEDMAKVVPSSEWEACTGPKGTVIIADNARFFHHGKTPLKDRYTLFYAYAYRQPKRPETCQNSAWRKGLPFMKDKLSQRQRDSIWGYESLDMVENSEESASRCSFP
ncbi:MAG: hypothetical protein AAFS04_12520 [Cyanobacteria bacterium J06631_9]